MGDAKKNKDFFEKDRTVSKNRQRNCMETIMATTDMEGAMEHDVV